MESARVLQAIRREVEPTPRATRQADVERSEVELGKLAGHALEALQDLGRDCGARAGDEALGRRGA